MSWWEILIIVAAAGFVVAVIAGSLYRKSKGKTSCGCDCAGCPGCAACANAKKQGQEAKK